MENGSVIGSEKFAEMRELIDDETNQSEQIQGKGNIDWQDSKVNDREVRHVSKVQPPFKRYNIAKKTWNPINI